jgi:DNA-binding transcriptional LysR family regulator
VRHVVCGSPAYFSARGIPKEPAVLSRLTAVTFDMLGSVSSWNFVAPGSKAEQAVAIRSRLSVNTAEAAIDAAIAGVGVTRVLSYQVASAVADGKLQIVLAKYEGEPVPVSFVHGGQGSLPLKIRAFLDFAAPRVRARIAGRASARNSEKRKK